MDTKSHDQHWLPLREQQEPLSPQIWHEVIYTAPPPTTQQRVGSMTGLHYELASFGSMGPGETKRPVLKSAHVFESSLQL